MPTTDQFLAIDCGTQSLRALIFDTEGRLIAKIRVPYKPYVSPRPGWAEQDPEVYWRALCRACRELWLQPGVVKEAIHAVGLTAQRGTVVNVGADGQALRPAILWLDRRTVELPPIGGLYGAAFKLIGLGDTIATLQANAESNWLRTHQPELWHQTHKYLLLSGYLTYRLTGCFTDATACQVGYLPFDYRRHCWARPSDWRYQALGIEPQTLPELVAPGRELGRITPATAEATGIPVNLPLIAAAADKACEVLGSGALIPEVGHLSYGTTATFNVNSRRYREAISFLPPYPAAVPDTYNLEIQVFRGYWLVEWFKEEFCQREIHAAASFNTEPEKLMEDMIRQVPPGSEGLLVQPFWSPGLRVPGAEARGTILGFNDRHTRAHVYRAILEGIAYALREGQQRVVRRTGVPLTSLRVSGGGSQSDTALQITADIFGLPTHRPHTYEASGLGVAIILAVSTGVYPDYATAVRAMSHDGHSFEPRPVVQRIYNDLFEQVYLKTYPRVRPLYKALRRMLR